MADDRQAIYSFVVTKASKALDAKLAVNSLPHSLASCGYTQQFGAIDLFGSTAAKSKLPPIQVS